MRIWASYVKAFESYLLTDIQTVRQDLNSTPRRFAGGQLRNISERRLCVSRGPSFDMWNVARHCTLPRNRLEPLLHYYQSVLPVTSTPA